MGRYSLTWVAAFVLMTGVASAQIIAPTDRPPIVNMPVFNASPPSSPPAPTTVHGVDAAGNAVDTTTYYRNGPFGTYADHTTTTTYPPGNPAAGTSITH
jgi:hypothetical protein